MQRGCDQPKRLRLLGRLPALTLIALAACEPTSAPAEAGTRSEAVAAKAAPSSPAAPASSAPVASHAPPSSPRRLCEKELALPGRRLPRASFTPVAAPGATSPSTTLAARSGRWLWINFFAAWCGPCKEEMPRLRAFQEKLASSLEVAFVSLDDDERQLRQLLAAGTVRSALWLEPGKTRTSWLTALDLKESPDLPAHVLVDPTGKVRCVLGGAIEDADFPAVAAIVKR